MIQPRKLLFWSIGFMYGPLRAIVPGLVAVANVRSTSLGQDVPTVLTTSF